MEGFVWQAKVPVDFSVQKRGVVKREYGMLNVLLLMEPSTIRIQGIDGVFPPPIEFRGMEKTSVPISFHKLFNFRL